MDTANHTAANTVQNGVHHNTGTYRLSGYALSGGLWVTLLATFESQQTALVHAACLPKRCKVRAYNSTGSNGQRQRVDYWSVEVRAELRATGATGTANEAGAKRLRSALKGVSWVYEQARCGNFATAEQLEAAIFGTK